MVLLVFIILDVFKTDIHIEKVCQIVFYFKINGWTNRQLINWFDFRNRRLKKKHLWLLKDVKNTIKNPLWIDGMKYLCLKNSPICPFFCRNTYSAFSCKGCTYNVTCILEKNENAFGILFYDTTSINSATKKKSQI